MTLNQGEQQVPKTFLNIPKNMLPWVIGGTCGFALLVLIGVFSYALAAYPKIYPNVYVENVPVGGMSSEEATSFLNKGYSAVYEGKSIDLTIDGHKTTITAQEVSAGISAADTAEQAYSVGRDGSFFSRVGTVISSPFSKTNIEIAPEFSIDRDALTEKIQKLAATLDKAVEQYNVDIREEEIIIKNAKAGRTLPQDALVGFIVNRFETRDFSPVLYETEEVVPEPLNLDSLYTQVYVAPKDAYVDLTDKNDVKIMPESEGVSFDLEAARGLLSTDASEIIIPLESLPASINMSTLEKDLFRDELGRCTTSLNAGNAPRTNNIRLAASFINGTILMPGEVFSYNETVGRRTPEKGFKEAGAYVNGKLVPEVGGGICQLSSTLYVATLKSNLKIVNRQNHSMNVAYLSAGLDATVNWGTIDYKFENDTKYPIRVSAVQEGSSVTVIITGTMEEPFTVDMELEPLAYNSYTSKTVLNPTLAPGARKVVVDGHNGSSVQSYRIVKDKDGKVISRTAEAKSTYRRVDQVVEVGPDAVDVPVTNPDVTPVATDNPADVPPVTEQPPVEETPVSTPEAPPAAEPVDDMPLEP